MVVVGKVVGGDDVDAGILLDLPVGETEPLGLGEEVILGELASPVGLVGLFEITEDTNAALGGGLAFGGWIPEDSEKTYGNPNTEEDTILTVVARRDSLLVAGGESGLVLRRRKPLPGNGWVKEEDWVWGEEEEEEEEGEKKAGGGGGAPNKGTGEGGAPEWRDEKRCGEKSSTRPVSVSVQCVLVSRRGSGR